MQYNPNKHHRRSIRLQGWDYSQEGFYCLTLCVQHRDCLLGEIVDGQVVLSELGQIVADEWERSPHIRQEIELDEWVVMPNHFHAIIRIINPVEYNRSLMLGQQPLTPTGDLGEGDRPKMRPKSISSLMAGFKSITTARINTLRQTPGVKVWQHNYYDSIIRSERGLERIREYIRNNPKQ